MLRFGNIRNGEKVKVLFLATYGDFLATFEYSNITLWQELGVEVHCASNFSNEQYNLKTERLDKINVKKHEISFSRNPFDIANIRTYKELVKLIKKEEIDIIDCHNAVVGVFARMAASHCKVDKVIYTPHSFFFYRGCPKKNELIFKNVEAFMAKRTDLLVSINKEDYEATLKMKIRGKALYVPGIGVDTKAIFNLKNKRLQYCEELGIPVEATIFISVGELIKRKNHITAIKAFAEANIPNSYYLICGIGELTEYLTNEIRELGISDRVKLLGYRLDAKELMKSADVYVFPSYQEGLPVALMEAMACGKPCLTSEIRGNVDLIQEEKGGYFFKPNDISHLASLMNMIVEKRSLWEKIGQYNIDKVKECDIQNVRDTMREEYLHLLQKEKNNG